MKPAEMLVGTRLAEGWRVVEKLDRAPDATGGRFSVPYLVERERAEGTREVAFLKALDFSEAAEVATQFGLHVADVLKSMLDAFIHERDLVNACTSRRMRNVIAGRGSGEYELLDSSVDPLLRKVSYLILERADGDIRGIMNSDVDWVIDEAWKLRVLHGVANGLRQLHQADIAHQDLKPSNVMSLDGLAKIGDLGRSVVGGTGPAADLPIAGDFTYAPPELLYREVEPDDVARRRQCDAYHLGSLATYLIADVNLTPAIFSKLHSTFHFTTWPGDYRNVLPYVQLAYDEVIEEVMAVVSPHISERLELVIRELSDPQPERRGDARATDLRQRISFERYVSAFDLLSRRVHASPAT